MNRKVLLVPEVHFVNWPFYLLLSVLFRIIAYKIDGRIFRFANRKIELLRLEDYFDWEESTVAISDVAAFWERNILSFFPTQKWQTEIAGKKLDMSRKAMQEFGKELEKTLILQKIASHLTERGVDAFVVQSAKSRYLGGIINAEATCKWSPQTVIAIGVQLDKVYMYAENVVRAVLLLVQLLYGLFYRWNRTDIRGIKYVWDGISPRELSVDPEKVFFPWIVDNRSIRKDQVLFLLPTPDFQMKAFSNSLASNAGYKVSSHFEIARHAPAAKTACCFIRAMKIIAMNVLFSFLSIEKLLTAKYSLKILPWLPMIDHLNPIAYITSGSSVTNEDPIVIYLKQRGIKTIVWYYGTNSYLFVSKNKKCDFRNVVFFNMLSRTHIVWNNHYKEFIESHAPKSYEIIVKGPLMAGDEKAINIEKNRLLERLGFSNDVIANGKNKFVSVFDVPPVSGRHSGHEAIFPSSNTEEYNYAFIRDVVSLLDEFEDICLIYKPKRSISSGKFSYSKELRNIFERLLSNPRAVLLDYNINPWTPIAASDICIGIPFESPVIVAFHYGKPAFFHDPFNIALHHRYDLMPEIISHSYDEMRSKVNKWLLCDEGAKIVEKVKTAGYTGIEPGTNSTDKFREYLINPAIQ